MCVCVCLCVRVCVYVCVPVVGRSIYQYSENTYIYRSIVEEQTKQNMLNICRGCFFLRPTNRLCAFYLRSDNMSLGVSIMTNSNRSLFRATYEVVLLHPYRIWYTFFVSNRKRTRAFPFVSRLVFQSANSCSRRGKITLPLVRVYCPRKHVRPKRMKRVPIH